ncbi:MAG: hypothetical protein OQJ97_06570 [Rhodospirillales bacterium]|nr:hypothetical protein [Rhodospirillales bacterium]
MSNDVPNYYADAVVNVTHVNGVFRITFAQQATSDTMDSTVQLLLPANQLGAILTGIGQAAENITSRLKEEQKPDAAPAKKKAPAKTTKKAAPKSK